MKTCLVVPLILSLLTNVAQAGDPFATRVAGCIGRYSAEVENAWLYSAPESDALAHTRENFVAILDAVAAEGERDGLLAYRIDVKFAHSELLKVAGFSKDASQAQWARAQSTLFLQSCASMLLDS